MTHPLTEETRYRLLKYLADHPEATQRDLSRALGISLGKVNYCIRALIGKGLVKARNFSRSNSKAAYAYILTPRGVEEKVQVTYAFLRRKLEEYSALEDEIERLTAEVRDLEAR